MFAGLAQRGRNFFPARSHLAPEVVRKADDGVGREKSSLGKRNEAEACEPREDAVREVVTHLVETKSTSLTFSVLAGRAERREVVFAIDGRGLIEVRGTLFASDTQKRVQRQRRRAIGATELVENGLDLGFRHCGGRGRGAVVVAGRGAVVDVVRAARVVSMTAAFGFGSRYTPAALSITVTFETR